MMEEVGKSPPETGQEPTVDSTKRIVDIFSDGDDRCSAGGLSVTNKGTGGSLGFGRDGWIYGLSFGCVIAEVMILAPMESVCGTINMSSST